jgi:hypothetical protein
VIRARVQHNNKEYHLGQYATKKEAEAARTAARRVLETLDANRRRPTLPVAEVLEAMVRRGVFDAQPSLMLSLAEALLRRQKMLSYRQRRTLYPGLSDGDRRNLAARVAPKNSIR